MGIKYVVSPPEPEARIYFTLTGKHAEALRVTDGMAQGIDTVIERLLDRLKEAHAAGYREHADLIAKCDEERHKELRLRYQLIREDEIKAAEKRGYRKALTDIDRWSGMVASVSRQKLWDQLVQFRKEATDGS